MLPYKRQQNATAAQPTPADGVGGQQAYAHAVPLNAQSEPHGVVDAVVGVDPDMRCGVIVDVAVPVSGEAPVGE
jgi:hypothetical protein